MGIIKSIGYSDREILQNIRQLYLNSGDFELDPTYSKGNFYKELPKPKYRMDLEPQNKGCICADVRNLPLKTNSINNVVFDPPFIVRVKSETKSKIHNRFSSVLKINDLYALYNKSLIEFARILKQGGYVFFKCQDTIDSGKQYWSHIIIKEFAESAGLYTRDLFVLVAKTRLIRSGMKQQLHARKFHAYWWVFQKRN